MARILATFCLPVAVGCVEYDFTRDPGALPRPDVAVQPAFIAFDALDPGEEDSAVVTIANDGEATLNLLSLDLGGDATFTVSTDGPLGALAPGEQAEVLVTYTAWSDADAGWLHVTSDDPDQATVTVPLSGGYALPVLQMSPSLLDFGTRDLDSETTESLRIANIGTSALEVTDLLVVGEPFSAALPARPFSLSPGEFLDMPVTYAPSEDGEATGRIWAQTDAGSGSDVVTLRGVGAPGPVAVCSVSPDEAWNHTETPTWTGDASYDPSGAEITSYTWTLVSQPTGSTAAMPAGNANRLDFAWDLVGTYVATLTVVNARGVASAPCTATLETNTDDALWVEMYWAHPNDDMDLHLLKPGGATYTGGDCYFGDCTHGLDWGVPGTTTDDPSLDIDDIPGIGPENIRLAEPAEGVYTVMVQDYPTTGIYEDANAVTVHVYVDGVLTWTDTRDLLGEGAWESFATVTFPGGEVTAL